MFNSTTLIRLRQGFDGHGLRRTGRTRRPERLFIFLLSLLCFSNSFCMESYFDEATKGGPSFVKTSDFAKASPDKTADRQGNFHKAQSKNNNAILALARYGRVLKKEYSLDALPDELLLNIFKYCAEGIQDELFLGKMFRRLALTNERFNVLLQDETILLDFFNILEKIKQKYYKSWDLNYEAIQNNLNESYVELSGSNLIENMKKFKFAKKDNLNGMMRKEKGKFLLEGAKKGDLEIVNLALSNDADIEIKDNDLRQSTPLMITASNGNENLVKFLLNKNAKIDIWIIGRAKNKSIAELLIEKCLSQGADAFDVLMKCLSSRAIVAAQILIEKNRINIHDKDELGYTPLIQAARYGAKEIVEILVNVGSDINNQNILGASALHWAAENGNLEIVNFLLSQNNILIDLRNNALETPLLSAICSLCGKYMEIIEALINKGSDIEAKNKIGRTPLMYAAYYNCQDIAQFLLEKGANIYEKDNHGKTALDIAREYDQKQMIYILKGGWKGKIKELVSFSLTTWGCASLTVLLIKSLNDYTNA